MRGEEASKKEKKAEKAKPAPNARPCGKFTPSAVAPYQCATCSFNASAHAPSAR
jgi:hypothetical protein